MMGKTKKNQWSTENGIIGTAYTVKRWNRRMRAEGKNESNKGNEQ